MAQAGREVRGEVGGGERCWGGGGRGGEEVGGGGWRRVEEGRRRGGGGEEGGGIRMNHGALFHGESFTLLQHINFPCTVSSGIVSCGGGRLNGGNNTSRLFMPPRGTSSLEYLDL